MIQGFCEPRFAAVASRFAENFDLHGEVGASVCVTFKGETVVDLWGGWADPTQQRPWERDTLAVVWSSTKGAVSLCAHLLSARGQLDLDAPVAQYWPEFAAQGKERITVAMLLSHQAGLAAFNEALPAPGFLDWETVVRALAAEKPLWEPGRAHGYHALTFGHLIGELVRRISGRSLGRFFKEELAEPLGLDFFIGLPSALEARIAPLIPPTLSEASSASNFLQKALSDPTSIPYKIAHHSGNLIHPSVIDSPEAHAAEIPAANGISHGRGLAGLYRPFALGGAYAGKTFVSRADLIRMAAVAVAGFDQTLQLPTRFSLGFAKAMDNRRRFAGERDSLILSEAAFGHTGNGGSIGFADPEAELSFGYVMNRMGCGIALNARGQGLIDAAYASLGYRQAEGGGVWYA